MDKLTEYPKLLKRILAEYIELCNRRPNPELLDNMKLDDLADL